MVRSVRRLALALAAPLLLVGCLLTPGKFDSKLTIDADRSFSFAYKGEVYALDPSEEMNSAPPSDAEEPGGPDDEASFIPTALQDDPAAKKAETEAKRRAIAEALRKEYGYRSVEYLGDGRYMIDYAISGTLTHNFVFPFNVDAEAVFPFLMVELRANGTVRLRAPGFANDSDKSSQPGASDAARHLDGVFALDTNAEIVSQNSEDGAKTVDGRTLISWRATPVTKDAPMAVLRLAP